MCLLKLNIATKTIKNHWLKKAKKVKQSVTYYLNGLLSYNCSLKICSSLFEKLYYINWAVGWIANLSSFFKKEQNIYFDAY